MQFFRHVGNHQASVMQARLIPQHKIGINIWVFYFSDNFPLDFIITWKGSSEEVWVPSGWLRGVTLIRMFLAASNLGDTTFTWFYWCYLGVRDTVCMHLWHPTLKGKGAPPRFVNAHGEKEQQKSEGLQKFTLVNYTLGMEIGRLVSNLLYKHISVGVG